MYGILHAAFPLLVIPHARTNAIYIATQEAAVPFAPGTKTMCCMYGSLHAAFMLLVMPHAPANTIHIATHEAAGSFCSRHQDDGLHIWHPARCIPAACHAACTF
jgi:hypothetical protein